MKQQPSEKELQSLIPLDNEDVPAPDIRKPTSIFGLSEDEDSVPFFLEGTEKYVYTPTAKLAFEGDYAQIYASSSRLWHIEKFSVCRKVIAFYGFAAFVAVQPFLYTIPTIILGLLAPKVILSRGLLLDRIWLHKSGSSVKLQYRRFKFGPSSKVDVKIDEMVEPTGDKFGLWNLYEFPDDLRTYTENEALQKWAYAKRLKGWWSFLIIKGKPKEVNREVLINALNGVQIDTEACSEEPLEKRYRQAS
mmetsp:Transcript_1762/g.3787  ORF Transcript_1762/g.3787 Transcript_1762/m.3787 type:complete len:248 (+) Transcript_1762:1481-2224(+)